MRSGFRLLIVIGLSLPISANAQDYNANYAQDRAQIEDLQARYLFAMNWGDFETYASTFTEDGVLDWARGTVTGRDAIRREAEELWRVFSGIAEGDEPSVRRRHFIASQVMKIDGDNATGRAYWFEFDVEGPGHQPYVLAYGHYEDEMRRIDGKWYFSRRAIYNEILEGRTAGPENPAW